MDKKNILREPLSNYYIIFFALTILKRNGSNKKEKAIGYISFLHKFAIAFYLFLSLFVE